MRFSKNWLACGVSMLVLAPAGAWAQTLPTGGAYVAGSGSIASAGPTMTITQSSARGIINWQGFSIGAGGKVQFNNGSGATLNRVTGGGLSQIEGELSSTGSVYLINPNGVVVGPGGTVITGGSFVASTRNVTNSQFMAGGTLDFSGTSDGTVTNAGKIVAQGGDVVLIGQAATNTGSIKAPNGTAALAAGSEVVLSSASGPAGLYVAPDAGANGNVTNSGQIKAAAVALAAAGGNVYALAGNQSGLIQATGTKTVAGQVWLTAPNGTVSVDGSTVSATNVGGAGGTIIADGKSVDIGGTATLSASATAPGEAGGAVLVGVTAPGGVNEAQSTTVASGATISAAGNAGGAGGKIETSGQVLSLGAARVDAGSGGSWVLDPENLTIGSAAASTIETALDGGTSVTEETTDTGVTDGSGTTASGNGDIDVDAAITWNSSATLTLSAFNNVNIGATIDATNGGTLDIITGNNVGGTSASGTALNFTGGNIEFTGANGGQPEGSLSINGHAYTLIRSVSALDGIGSTGYYALAEPLNASGDTGFTPIGESTPFTGTFEGLGNTVSNLTIDDTTDYNVGLFGQVGSGGVVENVGLLGGAVQSTAQYASVGALVGYNDGTIEDAYATGAVTGGDSAVGGLVGDSWGTIQNAYATGAVTGSGEVGGLTGVNGGTIEDAYATGAATGGTGTYVGGLVGANAGTIEDTYATSAVAGGAGSSLGGLVGTEANNGGTYTDDYFDTTSSGITTGVGAGNVAGVTGLSTTQLEGSLAGFSSTVWSNVGGQTTPYLLNNIGQQSVYVGADTYTSTLITTLPELQAINNDLSGNYALAVDLNATGDTFTPIGESTAFTGTFDGLGNTISNLAIDDTTDTYVGLFGQLGNGVVENVGLLGDVIEGTAEGAKVGGLVGYNEDGLINDAYATGAVTGGDEGDVGGLVGWNEGTTEDAYATGAVTGGSGSVGGLAGLNIGMIEDNTYATGTVTGGNSSFVGGLVGFNNGGGTIENAYATGAVTGGTTSSVGGLAGENRGTIENATIEDAYATGAVTGGEDAYVGGLVGYNDDDGDDGTIEDAYATGAVTGGQLDYVGGLVGQNEGAITDAYATGAVTDGLEVGGLVGANGGTIENAYATGAVTDGVVAGGLVGYSTNGTTIEDAYATGAATGSTYAGGLVGYSANGTTIEDAYATGAATGGSDAGGLVGASDGGTYTDDYFDTTSSGTTTGVGSGSVAGVTGLSTSQLEGAVAGFSSAVWGNLGGQTTPYLLNNIGQQSVYVGADTYISTLIWTLPELQAINKDLSGNYALAVDLDATGYTPFTPIGGQSGEFTGTFDGLGNTISDLTIHPGTDARVGLFAVVGSGGVVENIGLLGESIPEAFNSTWVGGLAGINEGMIEDAYATGALIGQDNGANAIFEGGLVGTNAGTIEDAYATGSVIGQNDTPVQFDTVGGLVGANIGTIEDAYATGAVTGGVYSISYLGGLVGWNNGTIKDAYATGAVTGGDVGDFVGGLVGYNIGGIEEDVYAAGAVTGGENSDSYVGGLVGYNYSTAIKDTYATGAVTAGAGSDVGGLVGSDDGGTYTDDYFDTTSSGTTTGVGTGSVAGVTGLSTVQWLTEGPMVAGGANTFVNTSAWVEGYPYPVLAALPYLIINASGSQTYGASTPDITITSVTNENGDAASGSADTSGISWLTPATSASNVGSYVIGAQGATAIGYQIVYEGTLTVDPATLTYTATGASQTYGGATPTLTGEVTGFVNGQTLADATTGTLAFSTTANAESNVGTYDIDGSGLSAEYGNYVFAQAAGNAAALTVDPATLTYTASGASQTYGGATPMLTGTVSGFVNGQNQADATTGTRPSPRRRMPRAMSASTRSTVPG